MKTEQEKIIRTFEATNQVLDRYRAQWYRRPQFAAAVARAKQGVEAIRLKQSQRFSNETNDAPPHSTVIGNGATSLSETISHTRSIYRDEIDKMMERFRLSAPDFYKAYVSARIILDRTQRNRSKKNGTATALLARRPMAVTEPVGSAT